MGLGVIDFDCFWRQVAAVTAGDNKIYCGGKMYI